MSDFNISTPVYLVTGVLESGKTSFLDFTAKQDYFQIEGTTLLITCEEGEEEYDEEALAKANIVVEVIEKEEDFTPERLQALDIIHQPERVVMEYNGMWLVSKFEEMKLTPGKSTVVSAPLIEESPLCIECRVKEIVALGSHDMFIADVVNVRADTSHLNTETGKLELAESNLLVYVHGGYYGLGEKIGKFGWSVEKKK